MPVLDLSQRLRTMFDRVRVTAAVQMQRNRARFEYVHSAGEPSGNALCNSTFSRIAARVTTGGLR